MDKNTITGFLLIALVVIGFTWFTKPTEQQLEQQRQLEDSIRQERIQVAQEQAKIEDSIQLKENSVNDFFQPVQAEPNDSVSTAEHDTLVLVTKIEEEKIVSLENQVLKVDFSTKGGKMIRAELKNYKTFEGEPLYLFDEGESNFSLQLENKSSTKLYTDEAYFTPVQTGDSSVLTMRLSYSANQYIDFIYSLSSEDYMIKFDILVVGMDDMLSRDSKETFVVNWVQQLRRQEKSLKNEQRYSRIHYKITELDVKELSDSKNEKEEIPDPVKWVAFKDQFFASALISDYNFNISVLSSRVLDSEEYLKDYGAVLYITPVLENNGTLHTGFRYFLGPLQYSMLKSFDDGVKDSSRQLDMDKMIPLGWTMFRWVNQYFILPLFGLLNRTGWSMGLIILLLTVIVKLIISPLTYKSFMSSAKMRVLRPQVEEINAKYPKQEQAMERQRATMDLYSKAGASPMSGCIPMLLQMPILIALFSFFPSAIELRQESFLWANDLSTYDSVLSWSVNIPFISGWLDNHLSLFCILMTATTIIYTKFNMDATNTGQQQMPGMKWMMYLMPLIFFFVLNSYPSGLTYYYFLSTLITILLTIGFRYMVDEQALLAKLEANKKKPKKKSGFMARLEEAQKLQQQQAKANAKKRR